MLQNIQEWIGKVGEHGITVLSVSFMAPRVRVNLAGDGYIWFNDIYESKANMLMNMRSGKQISRRVV